MSINSGTGVISGWLAEPVKTYSVTIGVTTELGTAGTTTFTWRAAAAADTGPAGAVVLAYRGKCLDDPGSGTTNGTRVDIGSCSGQPNQLWTMVQDRSVRVFGKCLDVRHGGTANGTAVDLYGCNGSAAQQWRIGARGQLVNLGSGKCLEDPGYHSANGTALTSGPATAARISAGRPRPGPWSRGSRRCAWTIRARERATGT